jgi:hypothetical protein
MKKDSADLVAARSTRDSETTFEGFVSMPTPAPAQSLGTDLLVTFRRCCDAHALRVLHGLISLHEAVDELQACAQRSGLVDLIGQDAVQALMSEAFAPVRSVLEPTITETVKTLPQFVKATWLGARTGSRKAHQLGLTVGSSR